MKTIDLSALDLQEMDHQQIKTTDGGMIGAGPLWWGAMTRAMFLSRTMIMV